MIESQCDCTAGLQRSFRYEESTVDYVTMMHEDAEESESGIFVLLGLTNQVSAT